MLVFKHVNLSMLVCFVLIKKLQKSPILREFAVMMPVRYLTDLSLVSMVMMHYQDGLTVDAA